MTSPSSFCDTRLKFLNLLLCAEECSQLISANVSNLKHTRFFANLRARLSLLFLSNSMIRFSYGAVLVVSTKLNEEIPANFFDERSDGLGLLRKNALSTRRSRRKFSPTDNMSSIHPNGNAYK